VGDATGGDGALRASDQRVAGLLEIAGVISSELDFGDLLKLLAQKTAQICGADRCSIYLLRGGLLEPAMSQYASGIPNMAMWRALKRLGPLPVEDFPGFERALREAAPVVFTDPVGAVPLRWIETFGIRSGLILPLVRHEQRIGVIHLNNCESQRAFGSDDVELGRVIAAQLALLIDNARLVQETRARLRETETLLSVGQAVNATLDLRDVGRRVSQATAEVVGADYCGIYLADDDEMLEPFIRDGVLGDWAGARDGCRHLAALLAAGGATLWSDDVASDLGCSDPVFRRFPLRSVLVTRLSAKDQAVGALVCGWREQRRRAANGELRVVEALAAQAAIGIVNARLYAKSEDLAVNRERVRVTQDLHDRLSQAVFSLGLKLEWCLHHTAGSAPLQAVLIEVRRQAQSIMTQMRHVISELSPETSPATDFASRLRELIGDFEQLSGVVVDAVQPTPSPALGSRLEDVLFTTLQEALANVAKHARATHVSVALSPRDGGVEFAVLDDGVGPPPAFAVGESAGHGLRRMIERIEALGGRIDIGRNMPSGFAVRGWAPTSRGPRLFRQ
jgi:two-component system, NarL family, sensor histidine kinase DevS